MKIFFPR